MKPSTEHKADNPFRVFPQDMGSGGDLAGDRRVEDWFQVHDGLLICGPDVVLPEVCCETLETADLVRWKQTVTYPWHRLVLFRRSCRVICFQSRYQRRRRWIRNSLWGGLVLLAAALLVSRVNILQQAYVIDAVVVVTIWSIQFIVWKSRPLRLQLVEYEKPDVYYISGFSSDYLRKVAQLQESSI